MKKYIVDVERADIVDIYDLCRVLEEELGLDQDDVFDAFHSEEEDESFIYFDGQDYAEMLGDFDESEPAYMICSKILEWIEDGKLPNEFRIHVY